MSSANAFLTFENNSYMSVLFHLFQNIVLEYTCHHSFEIIKFIVFLLTNDLKVCLKQNTERLLI